MLRRQGQKQGEAFELGVRGNGSHSRGGETWWVSEYILKVEYKELTDGLDMWDERKREVKDDTKFFGLSKWKCHLLK